MGFLSARVYDRPLRRDPLFGAALAVGLVLGVLLAARSADRLGGFVEGFVFGALWLGVAMVSARALVRGYRGTASGEGRTRGAQRVR
jgi:hypothetical protein